MLYGFSTLALICGCLAIWGKHESRMWVHWTQKPATMLWLIALALLCPSLLAGGAYPLFITALCLCLIGDVWLMLPPRLFLPSAAHAGASSEHAIHRAQRIPFALGLVFFLLGHVAYVVSFSIEAPWQLRDLLLLLPLALGSFLLCRKLWPHLGPLWPAIVAYVVVLTLTAWRLLARRSILPEIGSTAWLFGALGGLLFLVADGLLAWRRLAHRPVPYALELGLYFAAQWCIVRGTLDV